MLAAVPAASLAIVHLPARLWPLALERAGPAATRAGCFAPIFQATGRWRRWPWPSCASGGLAARVASRPLGRVASRRAMAGLETGGAVGQARGAGSLAGWSRGTGAPAADRGQALPHGAGRGVRDPVRGARCWSRSAARSPGRPGPSAPRTWRALRRALAARRLPAAVRAAAASRAERRTRAIWTGASIWHEPSAGGAAGRDPKRRRSRAAAGLVPRRRLASRRFACGPRSPRRARPGARFPGREPVAGPARPRRRDPDRARHAEAEAAPPAPAGSPAMASGGGYSGPLAYRQGKGMRPDVAAAFDRMAAAARRAGISLVINSALSLRRRAGAAVRRSIPDPRWVAPPGQSLHRCATELDLGPSSRLRVAGRERAALRLPAALLLGAVAFRLTPGPGALLGRGRRLGLRRPAPTARDAGRRRPARPSCPRASATPILRAAARWNVSAGAAGGAADGRVELQPVRGLARRRPGHRPVHARRPPPPTASTTRSTPPAAIDAQAHLMSDLLRQFGSRAARPRRLQRRPRRRWPPATASRRSPRPRPTSPASSACWAARASWRRRRSRCGW